MCRSTQYYIFKVSIIYNLLNCMKSWPITYLALFFWKEGIIPIKKP